METRQIEDFWSLCCQTEMAAWELLQGVLEDCLGVVVTRKRCQTSHNSHYGE